MDKTPGYDFFTQASKLILFIPVILLVYIIILKWGNLLVVIPAQRTTEQKTIVLSPTPKPVSLNLTGPFACEGDINGGTASALIKDKMVTATFSAEGKLTRFLLKDDCAYTWDPATKKGTKTCGLSSQIGILDSLLSMGLITVDSLLSTAGMNQSMIKKEDANSFVQSCITRQIPSLDSFVIPKGVQFTEKKK